MAACSEAGRALFRALVAIGLDRQRFSIHEMLTDILEVVAVHEGLRPAQLSGHGERAEWQLTAFADAATTAGLRTVWTPPIAVAGDLGERIADEFPGFAAAWRDGGRTVTGPAVLWIFREPAREDEIGRAIAGDSAALGSLLDYPPCCVAWEADRDRRALRALMALYRAQHGIADESGVLAAIAGGVDVVGDAAASAALENVWQTRLRFPWLGYSACPTCLGAGDGSASGHRSRRLRELAFELDPAFARALWRAARGEAALASRGDCRALDPTPADRCPCGSSLSFGACCSGREELLPEFR